MEYEVHMTVSIGVIVNTSDEETAIEKSTKRVERRIDGANNMYMAMCTVDTVEPADITLEEKRRKAEDALVRLTQGKMVLGE
ncbi:MAG: hypothetical protein J5915_03745 [Acidaminococcaceae bacterium]|nr:hypothetical protein [Acidaminococcaceae bacterium]